MASAIIILSILLMIAILLQSRGSGLGASFGGDSTMYRSRRGIERRLWQFTVAITILLCVFVEATVFIHT